MMRIDNGPADSGESANAATEGPIRVPSSKPDTLKADQSLKSARLKAILAAIDRKVLPILAKSNGFEQTTGQNDRTLERQDIAWFAARLIADDRPTLDRFLDNLRARGWRVDRIYLDVLTKVAQHLGEQWLLDELTFTDVTLGAARLRQIMGELTSGFYDESSVPDIERGHVLLAPASGEQHLFGVTMVAEFFDRAGWRVTRGIVASSDGIASQDAWLTDKLASEAFDIVGFSVSNHELIPAVARNVTAVRNAYKDHPCKVIVGGPAISDKPELAKFVGADDFALDAVQALMVAERLVPRPKHAVGRPHS